MRNGDFVSNLCVSVQLICYLKTEELLYFRTFYRCNALQTSSCMLWSLAGHLEFVWKMLTPLQTLTNNSLSGCETEERNHGRPHQSVSKQSDHEEVSVSAPCLRPVSPGDNNSPTSLEHSPLRSNSRLLCSLCLFCCVHCSCPFNLLHWANVGLENETNTCQKLQFLS